ncbi:esterase-like activity of phytase family protein [Hirschia litorea]|uniref:Esterase-like activity of phytase family protein n=1 Tax=Hirschia litorea TaxID=1199156 RepID=A0ABW2IJX1_9PROT
MFKVSQNNIWTSPLPVVSLLVGAIVLAGCASQSEKTNAVKAVPDVSQILDDHNKVAEKRWLLGEQSGAHYRASCPDGTPYVTPETISLQAHKVEVRDTGSRHFLKGTRLPRVEFVAGYHLTSDNPRFGGISGIDTLNSGDLLAVTDQGDFLWIGMDEYDHLQPVSAQISMMRDANGNPYDNKADADSEGLAVDNGLAFVSFEREHRIEAFDLETCGANARGSRVFTLDKDRDNVAGIRDNGGMEALALTDIGGLIMGVETLDDGKAQLSFSPKVGMADFRGRLDAGNSKQITGSDYLARSQNSGELYSLHRYYSPLTGAQINVLQTQVSRNEGGEYILGESVELLSLKLPGVTDNFEGISVRRDEDGNIRLFIVSDDNFSPKQRSLLLIFNVVPKGY